MADITFACTACGKTLAIDESLVGQDVACPACSRVMTVPRRRAPLTVKGRPEKRAADSGAQAAPEKLSGLADINAFGNEREHLVLRRRRWTLVWQILAAIGMLATLVVVVSVAYRFFDSRETRKRAIVETALRQEERQELRHRQQLEARQMNLAARRKQGVWSLDDAACARFWRALNTCYPARQEAQARFDFWVSCDADTYGLFSEVFRQIRSPGDIETACQRLAGFSLGLQGESARLPPLAEFRALARESLAETE